MIDSDHDDFYWSCLEWFSHWFDNDDSKCFVMAFHGFILLSQYVSKDFPMVFFNFLPLSCLEINK